MAAILSRPQCVKRTQMVHVTSEMEAPIINCIRDYIVYPIKYVKGSFALCFNVVNLTVPLIHVLHFQIFSV